MPQSIPSISPSAYECLKFSSSLSLHLLLITGTFCSVIFLPEETEQEKAVKITAFTLFALSTVIKLTYTASSNRLNYSAYRQAESRPKTDRDEKQLRHDLIQTTCKLGMGAFGWQLAFMLTQGLLGYEYDADFRQESWGEKFLIWVVTGISAAVFLNAAIFVSQLCLFHWDEGVAPAKLICLGLQLNFSVLVADGLWLLFTDVCFEMSRESHLQALTIILAIFLYPAAYLAQSFIFKNLHNSLNYFHFNEDYYIKFVCDNEFVGVLWGAYFGFKFLADAFYAMTTISFSNHRAGDILAACFVAGFMTAILPGLIGLGNYLQNLPQTDDVEHQDKFLITPLLVQPSRCKSVYRNTNWFYPLKIFARGVNECVAFAADSCPRYGR